MGNWCSSSSSADEEKRKSRQKKYAEAAPAEPQRTGPAIDRGDARISLGYREFERLFAPDVGATALACVDERSFVVGSEEGDVQRVDLVSGEVIQNWRGLHKRDVNKALYSQPTQRVYTCSRDKTVKSVHIANSEPERPVQTFTGHDLVVTCVAANSDGTRIVSGSRDNTFRLWDVERGFELDSQDRKLNVIHSCAWVEELGLVAQGGEDLAIRLWDYRVPEGCMKLSLASSIENFDYHPVCMALVPDQVGTTIATGHNGFNGTGAMVSLWDIRMQRPLFDMRGHDNTVRWVTMPGQPTRTDLKPGQQLFSASDDNTVREWDLSTQKEVASYRVTEGRLTAFVEVPTGAGNRHFVGSCRSGTVFSCVHDAGANTMLRAAHFGPAIAE